MHDPQRGRLISRTLYGVLVSIAQFVLPLNVSAELQSQAPRTLDAGLHHLRSGNQREWTSFPQQAESTALSVRFNAEPNSTPWCLRLRQQDVKQSWEVRINGNKLGTLAINENDMIVYFDVPPQTLSAGSNTLIIDQSPHRPNTSDDIRVGELVLFPGRREEVLREGTLQLEVREGEKRIPCRLTIVNQAGSLQSVFTEPSPALAVRPGIVYTASGNAMVHLPAGRYRITAGRGFEYSQSRRLVTIEKGQAATAHFTLRRVVPTEGYIACDTHVHTRTHSGHGDATVQERMVTLAGEGIELPIATDHNVHIDHRPFADEVGVSEYFTPVIGNEVTTSVGHFNVFPVEAGSPIPNFRLTKYREILAEIFRTPGVKIAILNHARDIHGGTRPFGPQLHNAVVGENLSGWALRFNAMEVINSGATQTKPLQLLHDWMGLLNRGRRITPVGSSDSHDVGRHFVGQGRTYIRCDDRSPGEIDVDSAVNSFLQGRVLVSYGLLVELRVNGKYRSGEIVPLDGSDVRIQARVLGPEWVSADKLMLFANGQLVREASISVGDGDLPAGTLWQQDWALAAPPHDLHLVAISTGPGIQDLSWPTAKPYQPTSLDWDPRVLGCSGAVWLDVDGDGWPKSAREYARQIVTGDWNSPNELITALRDYDTAVAAQASFLLQRGGVDLFASPWQDALATAPRATAAGFHQFLTAWRETQQARAGR